MDIAVFSGSLANYTFSSSTGGQSILVADTTLSRDVTDSLFEVEVLSFTDGYRTKANIMALGNSAPTASRGAVSQLDDTPIPGSVALAKDDKRHPNTSPRSPN